MVHGAFPNPIQPTICIAPWKVFLQSEVTRLPFGRVLTISRDRSGGSSVIGYLLPQSVSVFVRELSRRSADQLVVAQPGANARRWERIFWGFHNTGNDVLRSTSSMATCASTSV
jgi:hypothetical protein